MDYRIDRRRFLKTTFIFTGGLFVPATGIIRPSLAAQWWAMQHGRGDPGLLWADWDEAFESTFPVDMDGDGVEDTNICFMENTSAGGNETSRGVLTGADRVYTQSGNVPGATGDPPYRTFTAGTDQDDQFNVTDTYLNSLITGSEFSFIIKCKDLANHHGTTEDYITYLKRDSNSWIRWFRGSDDTLRCYLHSTERNLGAVATNITLYLCVWLQSGYNTKIGYCSSGSGANGQPTKLSDFGADVIDTGEAWAPPSGAWEWSSILGYSTRSPELSVFYSCLSKISLIDNSL